MTPDPREIVAKAIYDAGFNHRTAADAVLAALTEAGIVLCRKMPAEIGNYDATWYVPLSDGLTP